MELAEDGPLLRVGHRDQENSGKDKPAEDNIADHVIHHFNSPLLCSFLGVAVR